MPNVLSLRNENLPGSVSPHSWLRQAILNPGFTSLAQKPFRPGFRSFVARSYKPLTVFLLSLAISALCYLKMGREVSGLIATALTVGVGCVLLSVLAAREWKPVPAKHLVAARLLPGEAVAHIGTLVVGLLGLLFIYAKCHDQFTWTVYPTLSLLGGFALGFSGVMLLMHAVSPGDGAAKNSIPAKPQTPVPAYVIPERLDVLAGAVAASMILGTTLVEIDTFKGFTLSAGVVWLPAVLAWCGVCASWLTAKALKNTALDLPPATGRMLNVFVMTVLAYVLVDGMLPGYWVIEGTERLSSEIFLAAEIGIIGGFALMEIGCAYVWLRTRYYAWTFGRFDRESWHFKPFRHAFRTVCLVVPVAMVAWFLWYAFETVGLYGILVAAVAMLSNLNARLSFAKTDKLPANVAAKTGHGHGTGGRIAMPSFAGFFGSVPETVSIPMPSRVSRVRAAFAPPPASWFQLRPWYGWRFGGTSVRAARDS